MIFPIGDDQVKGGYLPIFSYGFIGINIIIFLIQSSLSPGQQAGFFNDFGSIPYEISHGEDLFTVLTSMFIHGDWKHLLGNMLFMWVFADNIEATIGNGRFLLFYFLGGIAAVMGHIFFNMNSMAPMIGASGAISAVMGAYLVMYPSSRIRVLLLIFPFRVSAWLFLGFWIWQQWMYGTASLTEGNAGGVAWWAHIAGFAMGLLSGFLFRMSGMMHGKKLDVD